jgi:hypothetical protein
MGGDFMQRMDWFYVSSFVDGASLFSLTGWMSASTSFLST